MNLNKGHKSSVQKLRIILSLKAAKLDVELMVMSTKPNEEMGTFLVLLYSDLMFLHKYFCGTIVIYIPMLGNPSLF